jgi:hypothetical protein
VTDWALELAENPNTYVPLRPGHERIVTDRYVLWLGGGDQPGLNVAQRFRFRGEELDEVRAEVHEHVRARGRTACSWEVGSSATPTDLVERLLALGLEEDDEPLRVGMALTVAPPEVPEVEVRRAESLDERRLAARIGATVFGTPYVEPAPPDSGTVLYLALVRARWDDAIARGAMLAVTDAGSQSRPILARLGFREICTIRALIDRL